MQLWRQLVKAHSRQLAVRWIMTVILATLPPLSQLCLYRFLSVIEAGRDSEPANGTALSWVLGLAISQALQAGVDTWLSWFTISRLRIPMESQLQTLVFAKSLRQYDTTPPSRQLREEFKKAGNNKAKPKESRSSVINHMKLDSANVAGFCQYNDNVIGAAIKLSLAGIFLVHLLGWKPAVFGLGALAFVLTMNVQVTKMYSGLVAKIMRYRDKKAHLLVEILHGMRHIRYSALERYWEERILTSRNKELDKFWKMATWKRLLELCTDMGPLFLSSIAFGAYVWQNGIYVKASVIFTSLGLFDQVRDAVSQFSELMMNQADAWTCVSRLETYLRQEEKQPMTKTGDNIVFEDATVEWPRAAGDDNRHGEDATNQRETSGFKLRDVNLEFPNGELSVIGGDTGSGKSLLLAAILGDVYLRSGNVRAPTTLPLPSVEDLRPAPESEWIVPHQTAFVSQNPWIESGTVRENILFGLEHTEPRYSNVLGACGLDKDMKTKAFSDGDQTEVGPRGVSLSGGQRWRIALARALYSRAGILLLDDVLSAVDNHVKQLVSRSLSGPLARGRTRILVTHHINDVLSHTRYLVHLQNGRVKSAGSVSEVLSELSTSLDEKTSDTADLPTDRITGQEEESVAVGRVKWGVYMAYFEASGGARSWSILVAVLLLGHFLWVAQAWSLKRLAEEAAEAKAYKLIGLPYDGAQQEIRFWMATYVALYFLRSFAQAGGTMAVYIPGLRASKRLFEQMVHVVLHAPMAWVDRVPAGRVLSRFTTDMIKVDKTLPGQTFKFLQNATHMVVILGASMTASGYALALSGAVSVVFVSVAAGYMAVAREVKRINAVTASPVYDQFSSVLSGLSTIRAFGRTEAYMDRMYDLIDDAAKSSWALAL